MCSIYSLLVSVVMELIYLAVVKSEPHLPRTTYCGVSGFGALRLDSSLRILPLLAWCYYGEKCCNYFYLEGFYFAIYNLYFSVCYSVMVSVLTLIWSWIGQLLNVLKWYF